MITYQSSFCSDSSQEDEFSFGMDIYDDFDSDSDGEAGNLVKEMTDDDFNQNNEQLLLDFSRLHILDNYDTNSSSYDDLSVSSEESINTKKSRKGSLVTSLINEKRLVGISLDLEHGGDKCGITQLSAVLFRLGGVEDVDIPCDSITEEVFNEYVKPPKDAIWNSKTQEVTGLHASHPSILNADPIETVWKR